MKKLNILQPQQQGGNAPRRVLIEPNLIRDSVKLDKFGNEVTSHDPRKRQIIRKNEDQE